MDTDNLVKQVLDGVVSGSAGAVAGQIVDAGIGLVISAITGKSSDAQQVLSDLNTITKNLKGIDTAIGDVESKVEELQAQLQGDFNALTLQISYSNLAGPVDAAARAINMKFNGSAGLINLTQADASTAATLGKNVVNQDDGVGNNLGTIWAAMLGHQPSDPEAMGLLEIWGLVLAQNAIASQGLTHSLTTNTTNTTAISFPDTSPTATGYKSLEQYFLSSVGTQIRGLILLVNAYESLGEPNLVANNIASFNQQLLAQCDLFLNVVESFAVATTQWGLIPLIQQSATNQSDPMALADAFLNEKVLPCPRFTVRTWTAQSTPTGNIGSLLGASGESVNVDGQFVVGNDPTATPPPPTNRQVILSNWQENLSNLPPDLFSSVYVTRFTYTPPKTPPDVQLYLPSKNNEVLSPLSPSDNNPIAFNTWIAPSGEFVNNFPVGFDTSKPYPYVNLFRMIDVVATASDISSAVPDNGTFTKGPLSVQPVNVTYDGSELTIPTTHQGEANWEQGSITVSTALPSTAMFVYLILDNGLDHISDDTDGGYIEGSWSGLQLNIERSYPSGVMNPRFDGDFWHSDYEWHFDTYSLLAFNPNAQVVITPLTANEVSNWSSAQIYALQSIEMRAFY